MHGLARQDQERLEWLLALDRTDGVVGLVSQFGELLAREAEGDDDRARAAMRRGEQVRERILLQLGNGARSSSVHSTSSSAAQAQASVWRRDRLSWLAWMAWMAWLAWIHGPLMRTMSKGLF